MHFSLPRNIRCVGRGIVVSKLRVHLVSALFGPDLYHYMSRQAHRYALPSPSSLAALTPIPFFNAFFASAEYLLCRKGNRCVKTESASRFSTVRTRSVPLHEPSSPSVCPPVPLLFGCTNTYAIFQSIFRF